MTGMFARAVHFSQNLNWETPKVESMRKMFCSPDADDPMIFNGTLVNWITGAVTDMSEMFHGAAGFNQDIRKWDTSNVTNMSGMFARATVFSQDLRGWKTGNVETMDGMFAHASSFNGAIGKWDTKNVTNMWYMFSGASKFDQDLSGWDVGAVTAHDDMFNDSGTEADTVKHPKFKPKDLTDFGGAGLLVAGRQAQAVHRGYV